MITVTFQILIAIAVMLLCYATVIHRIFIAHKMSDKLYKNFGLAFLGVLVYINCVAVMLLGFDCSWRISVLKLEDLTLEKSNELYIALMSGLNQMTGYLIAGIAFYMLTLLLIKSIHKDIEKELDKPKYRWGSIN